MTGWKRCMLPVLFALNSTWAAAADDLFSVVVVDVVRDDLRLYLADEGGQPLRSFNRLASQLAGQGRVLTFGMNAGMYHADGSPVGLLVMDGKVQAPLNLGEGPGNFYLKPNGVFLTTTKGAKVVDASDYARLAGEVRFATQSGPMLIKNGVVNPLFQPGSANKVIRNGVCAKGSTAYFVITLKPVNFHQFASFFRDRLGCTDALYLDGVVSSLFSPARGRHDDHAELGPMLGVSSAAAVRDESPGLH